MEESEISFRLALPRDSQEIYDFCHDHFLPEEPLCKFLSLSESKSWLSGYMRAEFFHFGINPCLEERHSVLAVDNNGVIQGILLGKIWTNATATKYHLLDLKIISMLAWVLPSKIVNCANLINFTENQCTFNPKDLIQDLGSDKLFIGEVLCVSKQRRGFGLGRRMLQRSLDLAREANCDNYAALATGIYSQAIFQSSGFKLKTESPYEDLVATCSTLAKDLDVFKPHTKAKVFYKAIG